jgi:hypothetical protein
MDKNPPRDWLNIISPCVIAMAVAIFGIIDAAVSLNGTGGWSGIVVIMCFIFLLAVIVIDVIVRLLVRKRTGLLWIIETVLLIITILLFRSDFF